MMDKGFMDHFLRMAQVRIDRVYDTVSQDSSYSSTAEKLLKISKLIDECKQELETW